jgi:hypothetical protein
MMCGSNADIFYAKHDGRCSYYWALKGILLGL